MNSRHCIYNTTTNVRDQIKSWICCALFYGEIPRNSQLSYVMLLAFARIARCCQRWLYAKGFIKIVLKKKIRTSSYRKQLHVTMAACRLCMPRFSNQFTCALRPLPLAPASFLLQMCPRQYFWNTSLLARALLFLYFFYKLMSRHDAFKITYTSDHLKQQARKFSSVCYI